MEYMAGVPDNAFHLAIVDPPYGIGTFDQAPRMAKPYNRKWNIPWNDSAPTIEYFNELCRVSLNRIVWGSNYYKWLDGVGGCIVWDKGNSSGVGSDCEIASHTFDKRVVKHYLQNIGFIGPEKGRKIHPCQKPVKLYEWLIKNYAKPGDRILDTHLGSGSSAIAAHYAGYDFVGCELDEDYYNAAVQRFNDETKQQALFK